MYACKIIRELTDMTYQDIADLFGQKHENVMHAIKVVDNDLEVMPKYEMYYLELRAMVEASDVYLNSGLAKKSVMSAIKQDVYNAVYNALMSKDMTELQQILKTIK
jgi:phage regulator Rha-like protein